MKLTSLTDNTSPYEALSLLSLLMLYQNLVLAATLSLAKTLIWRTVGFASFFEASFLALTIYCLIF